MLEDTTNKIIEGKQSIFDNEIRQEWLTVAEAADYLRIPKKALYNMCSSGNIKYYKLGKRSRFHIEDLRLLVRMNPRGGEL